VQSTFEHESKLVAEGFCVGGEAAFGCTKGTAGRGGEDAGEDEAKREEGGEIVGSIHAKNSQRVLLACFL